MPDRQITRLATGLIFGLFALPASADIFSYCEGDGDDRVCNFTNVKPADSRYTMILKSRSTLPGAGKAPSAKSLTPSPRAYTASSAAINASAYAGIINRAASQYALDPSFVRAVMHTESNFNPNARSPKGASGLMQLMPDTAKRYGVSNIFDPEQNVFGGARYLRDLLKMFNQNKHMALAAYNAGENSVLRHGGIPPYRETVNYVTKVLILHKRYQSQGVAMNSSQVNG